MPSNDTPNIDALCASPGRTPSQPLASPRIRDPTASVPARQPVARQGLAASIDVVDGDDRYAYPNTSPGGAFVISIIDEDATLTPRTETGDVVTDSSGAPIVHVQRPHSARFPWLDPDVKTFGSGGMTRRGVWAVTVGSNMRGFAVDLTDDEEDEHDGDDYPDATYGRGTVKFFLEHKGWGGITCPELDADIWVHFSAIDQPGGGYRVLTERQAVEFRCIPIHIDSWRYEATWVRVLPAPD
jgi:cold shock CspA family protein